MYGLFLFFKEFEARTAYIVFYFIVVTCGLSYGQVTYSYINESSSNISEDLLYYLEDPTGGLTIEGALRSSQNNAFQQLTSSMIPRHLKSVIWTKLYLRNQSTTDQEFVLRRTLGNDNYIDYFVFHNGTLIQTHKSGSAVPYEYRQVKDKNGIILKIASGETITLFSRISNDLLFRGGYLLETKDRFLINLTKDSQHYLFLIALFLGVVIVNLIVAYIFKEVRFVIYLFGACVFTAILLIYAGKDYQFFPYINQGWSNSLTVLQSLVTASFLVFTRVFLNIQKKSKLYLVLLGGSGVWLTFGLLGLSSLDKYLFYPQLILGMLSYAGIAVLGILHFIKDTYNATRFLLSMSIFIFLNLYSVGLAFGLFPYGDVDYSWVLLFVIIQSILFSFSMIQKDIKDAVIAMNKKYYLSKQKQVFLKNISHELRTPINGVVGAIELLLRTKKTPHQHELLDSADQAIQKIMSVVNDFVEVAISDGEFLRIKKEPYDFIQEINTVMGSLEKLAIVKGLRFEKLLPRTLNNLLVGDSKRVMFLISRLISLSIKYTSHGFVKLICEIDTDVDDKVEVHFIIQDSGTAPAGEFLSITEEGIDSEDADVKMAENYLFVQLLELISARVWYNPLEFNSEVIGTEYHMVIDQDIGEEYVYRDPEEKVTPLSAKGLSILVAEDDLVNQKIIAKTLENMNYSYHIVGNGSECVKEWLRNRYDLILMDIQMPVMNGYEAALEIRLREKMSNDFKHIPIIALSAREEMYMYNECKRNGINSYLPKPFKLLQLEKEIEQFFLL